MKKIFPLLLVCINLILSVNAKVVIAPTTQATNIVITNKTATSATISWTNGDGANRVVFVENPSGIAAAPYNNTTYTASTDWNAKGTKIGTSNYYCVYNGSGNTLTITNLAPNSTYAVRVSEYNGSAGGEQYFTSTATNNPITFTTLDLASAPTTQATNIVITNKTATSATISWTNGNGAKRVAFVENPSGIAAAPYDNTTYTASTDWNAKGTKIGASNYYCVYNGSGNTLTITNLAPNSIYTVRVSEYNGSAGSELYLTPTATDNPIIFTTLDITAAPTIQATNILITNTASTSATISWTNGNGAKRVAFVENPSGIAAAPYDNTTYTASTDWNTKGTKIGTSNYYCVYNGPGNTLTITNLVPNSKYTVRVSEYNGSAGSELYQTTTATDNPFIFYTTTNSIKQASDDIRSLTVFQNPTSGSIVVKSNKVGVKRMKISISNLQGKVLRKITTSQSGYSFDLTGVTSGIYIVTVDAGGATSTCKVIKK